MSPAASDPSTPGRSPKGPVVGGALLVAALTALAATQTWASGVADDPVLGRQAIAAGGRTLAPAAFGLALAAGAGVLAASVLRRIGRVLAGLAVLACGIGVAVAAFGVARDPAAALETTVAGRLGGQSGAALSGPAVTGWVGLTIVGGVLLAFAGLAVLLLGRRWAGLSERYESPAAHSAGAVGTPGSSRSGASRRGLAQPQADPGPRRSAGEAAPEGSTTPLDPVGVEQRARAARRRAVEDWDRLSAGDDPTR